MIVKGIYDMFAIKGSMKSQYKTIIKRTVAWVTIIGMIMWTVLPALLQSAR